MKSLTSVHHGLRKVRHFRSMVRLGSAWSVLLCVVLWALAAAFLLDFWIRMGRLERGILLMAVAGAALWALVRYLLPALRVREDDVALALLVEKRQGISSDLVAAIQFAEGGPSQYGSAALREAVVDYTAEASGGLNFLEGFSRERLLRRVGVLAMTAILTLGPAATFPRHTTAFLQRLLLGNAHYPTRTQIVRIESPAGRAAPYGRDVTFKVRAAGELPAQGRVELRALSSDLTTTIDLRPDPNDAALYVGKLPRALDDLSFVVHLGDAYTEAMNLKLIPLPLVTVKLDVTPPAYAAGRFQAESDATRQTVAPEGSRVGLAVSADKPLSGGTVTVEKDAYPLAARGGKLSLAPAGTVFEKVREPMRYKVQVTDADGLELERPVSGVIQVLPDQPPRVAAAAVSRYILPTASPMIMVKAMDDYGLREIVMQVTVAGSEGKQTATTQPVAKPEGNPRTVSLWHQLRCQPLQLVKGDRVTVTMEAVDYRGDDPGRTSRSDPVTFLVTDEQGLLEAMRKLDDRMVEKLDEIIRAQLGIGE